MADTRVSRRTALAAGMAGVASANIPTALKAAETPAGAPNVLRAEWYDVPADKTDGFLQWLHADFLPKLRALEGIVWVGHYKVRQKTDAPPVAGGPVRVETKDPTVPTGGQYVLITAGVSPETFLAWESKVSVLEKENAGKLGQRTNWRQAVFVEEVRVDGHDAQPGWTETAPPAVQMGNFNVRTPDDEIELGQYYRLVRFPELTATIGAIGARKLVSLIGWPKHGILYAFKSIEPGEQQLDARMAGNAKKPPPIKLRHVLEYVVHAPNAPHAGARIWPPV